jgi:hypothetical protein
MKALLLFTTFCLTFLPSGSNAQTVIHAKTPANPEIGNIIRKITDVMGFKTRFELRAAQDLKNVSAVMIGEKHFIFFDEEFLKTIAASAETDWATISIMAHEIGHHLRGHTLNEQGSTHSEELEADEFSGFVLRKMGASLDDAQAAMYTLSSEHGSATHPKRADRLKAIETGWMNADAQIIAENSEKNKAHFDLTAL